MGDLFYETLHKYMPPKLIYPGSSYIPPAIYRLKTYIRVLIMQSTAISFGCVKKINRYFLCSKNLLWQAISATFYSTFHLYTTKLHTKIGKINILLFNQPVAPTPEDKVQTVGDRLTETKKLPHAAVHVEITFSPGKSHTARFTQHLRS